MRQGGPEHGDPIRPLDCLKLVPFAPDASSDGMGWVGLEAIRWGTGPAADLSAPAITHHSLLLFARPPDDLGMKYEGLQRHVPPPAGSIILVPAGSPGRWRCGGHRGLLHIYLEPSLVERVAAEEFGLDPARLTIPPLDGLDLPHLRAAMGAVDAELTAGGAGGRLAAESLANVLAVHLIRHILAPRGPVPRPNGTLPRARLRAVVEYIEGHVAAGPSLEQMAAVARLSPYHFARQFRAATGLPPHQYVLARRVDRARQLLQASGGLSLTEIAARSGFSDQSQFSRHFKRALGVTPGEFRRSARIT
jgi:AraC family transcriptional regulator